jgi:hypothetical protein
VKPKTPLKAASPYKPAYWGKTPPAAATAADKAAAAAAGFARAGIPRSPATEPKNRIPQADGGHHDQSQDWVDYSSSSSSNWEDEFF